MPISSDYTPTIHQGTGSIVGIPTGFPFFTPADLLVTHVAATGVRTTWALDSDYTVTGGNGEDGTVTPMVAPAVGAIVVVERAVARTQAVDFAEVGSFRAVVANRAFDRLTLEVQDLAARIDRAPQFAPEADTTGKYIPREPGMLLGWDSAGENIIGLTPASTALGQIALDSEAQAKVAPDRVLVASNLAALGATDSFTGLVELATAAEAQAGADAARAVTPAGLKSTLDARTASETETGLIELASAAEARAETDAARAVTPATWAAAFDNRAAAMSRGPRQAVLSGKVDANGLPAFLAVSGSDILVDADASNPLVLNFAGGYGDLGPVDHYKRVVEQSTILNALLPRGVRNYLYASREPDGSITYGVTDIPPEYGHKREGVDLIQKFAPHTTYAAAYGTASASASSAGYDPWKAVDGNPATYWSNTSGTPAGWWRYVLQRQMTIRGFKLKVIDSSANNSPKDFTIRGGVAVDVPDEVILAPAQQTGWAAGETREFILPSPLLLKSYEVDITTVQGGAGVACAIAELTPLFTDDYLDLNTFMVKSPDNSQRTRLYLGHVDVSGAGVLSGLYCYATGVRAVRAVNGGANIAVNTLYEVTNPFEAPVSAGIELYIKGVWLKGDEVIYNPTAGEFYGTRITSIDAQSVKIKAMATALSQGTVDGTGVNTTSAPARIVVQRAF